MSQTVLKTDAPESGASPSPRNEFPAVATGKDDQWQRTLHRMLLVSLRKGLKDKTTSADLQALLEAVDDQPTLIFFLAALAEDPDYKRAWFDLATSATGDAKDLAIRAFIKHFPDNAAAYYLRAINQNENGNRNEATEALRAGNAQPVCRIYASPRPTQFDLHYPETDESFRKLDISGQDVPSRTLAYLLEKESEFFAWAWYPLKPLRTVATDLIQESARLRDNGQFQDAVRYVEAVRNMGLKLIRVRPTDFLLVNTGVAIVQTSTPKLNKLYVVAKPPAERLVLQAVAKMYYHRSKKLAGAMQDLIERLSSLQKEKFKDILSGKIDPLAIERKGLLKAIKEAGLAGPRNSK